MNNTENTEQQNGVKHHLPIVYQIYAELKKHHKGRNNAIKAADLADKFGIDKRTLRQHISTIKDFWTVPPPTTRNSQKKPTSR